MGITVLRCDDRLIHGQCIVKVLNDYKIDYIILVDAFTASNPVMSNIYKMSVPPNVHLDVASAQSAIALIEQAEESSERTQGFGKGSDHRFGASEELYRAAKGFEYRADEQSKGNEKSYLLFLPAG